MSTFNDDNERTDFVYGSHGNQWTSPPQGSPPLAYPPSPNALSDAPFYLPNVIAAIVASAGIVVGSIGTWASVPASTGTLFVAGMDFRGHWGLITLILGSASAIALFAQVNWGRTGSSLRWAVPIAWAVLVAGIGCLAIALVNIAFVTSLTTFAQVYFGIDHAAQVGWGLWLLVICSAALCITGAVVAVQVGNASQDYGRPSQAAWAAGWRWLAIGASAVIFVCALINAYRPLILDNHTSEPATATRTVTMRPSPSTLTLPAQAAPSQPAALDPTVPPNATRCSSNAVNIPLNNSAAGTDITSCPFAEAVRSQYLGQGLRATTVRLTVISPVTSQSYPMTCIGNHVVMCTGGTDAVVYLY